MLARIDDKKAHQLCRLDALFAMPTINQASQLRFTGDYVLPSHRLGD